ncbi:APC family permease [Oenococcus sicerae]|uniref:APC family permease n=1 Tax=Oenococcus sicerae TaxID=2203724 RepID=UPI0010AFD910|nr:putative amino acid permease YhdG [Oenococcus sicerae]
MGIFKRSFRRDSVAQFAKADAHLKRVLDTKDLVALGIGTVIGTGIFILPGTEAAQDAGPAVAISFLIAAIISGISGMAYAEFASAMPVAGSAYSYGSVVYGQVVGWFLGWSLILEYFLATSAVSVGFSSYLGGLFKTNHIHGFDSWLAGPLEGGIVNLPAVILLLTILAIQMIGLSTTRWVENIFVAIKLVILAMFIVVGIFFIKPSNYIPFYPKEFQSGPFGLSGIWAATSGIFFAFIGFDTLAAHTAEVKKPKTQMAHGIIYTVLIAAVLYTLFAIVLTGMVNYKQLNVSDPASFAFTYVGQKGLSSIIGIGSMIGMFTGVLALVFASSRLIYSFGRDGLLPKFLGRISGSQHVPFNALLIAGIIEIVLAGAVPLSELASLISAGTLAAFTFVNFGILPLRKRADINNADGFQVPGYPVVPIIGGLTSLFFITQLKQETLVMFAIWTIIGLAVYFFYGIRHSKLQQDNA